MLIIKISDISSAQQPVQQEKKIHSMNKQD